MISDGETEQIIGCEGETATFLKRSLVSLTLREFGFAPRQLNRWVSRGKIKQFELWTEEV